MVLKVALVVLFALLLGAGAFFGDPGLKGRVANMSCNDFLAHGAMTLEGLRGRAALIAKGGDTEMLAENCDAYPGKPMAMYFGWFNYLES